MSMFILALILGRLNLSMLLNGKKQKGAFISLTCLQLADQGKGSISREKKKKSQNAPRFFFYSFTSAVSALEPPCKRPESILFKVSCLLGTLALSRKCTRKLDCDWLDSKSQSSVK